MTRQELLSKFPVAFRECLVNSCGEGGSTGLPAAGQPSSFRHYVKFRRKQRDKTAKKWSVHADVIFLVVWKLVTAKH